LKHKEATVSELLTEEEWKARDDLRKYWGAFCDADIIPIDGDDFTDRLEKFGLVEWSVFTERDLGETIFADELGLEVGRPCWKLTAKGQKVFEKQPA
jgi:hypothetical protein